MESIKEVLSNASPFYRFQVFHAKGDEAGKSEKAKTVGMAYLKSGSSIYTLRLWTFLSDRFYLVAKRHDPEKFFVMTREPNRNPNSKNKYFWNIVGNAVADSSKGCIQIEMDLLERPIFMSIFPESSARSAAMLDPEVFEEAA